MPFASELLLLQAFNDCESEAVGEGGACRPGHVVLGPAHPSRSTARNCETMLNEELLILLVTRPSSPYSHCDKESAHFRAMWQIKQFRLVQRGFHIRYGGGLCPVRSHLHWVLVSWMI